MDFNKSYLGIEFGSTRIKAVLIDEDFTPVASGDYEWENKLVDGYWSYSLEEIHKGLKSCYKALKNDIFKKYGVTLKKIGAMGISAMMHGYMAFDEKGELLVPFRTWRNTTTAQASAELSEVFDFNVPQRWSVSHLYQAILSKEEHLSQLSYVTTLAVYINYLLTGKRVAGVGEASGMFPINDGKYDVLMEEKFDKLMCEKGYTFTLEKLFPEVWTAGEEGLYLTKEGALLLDEEGDLESGIGVCPPEGDAGTGMVATNSVKAGTGNVSAGTSIFSMLVLDKNLNNRYEEIDMVTTPDGFPVAMVHCNNCSSEIDCWVRLFEEFSKIAGFEMGKSELYSLLYKNAMNGDVDCGGVINYNFISGEPVAYVTEGRPMYMRNAEAKFNLKNFMRSQLYSTMATLKMGMDILFKKENATASVFSGHGGLFKVEGVAQQILADALGTPVCVMKTAGEGGAWGMAILASYMVMKNGMSLSEFLEEKVFDKMERSVLSPDEKGRAGFDEYMKFYAAGLEAERVAGKVAY